MNNIELAIKSEKILRSTRENNIQKMHKFLDSLPDSQEKTDAIINLSSISTSLMYLQYEFEDSNIREQKINNKMHKAIFNIMTTRK